MNFFSKSLLIPNSSGLVITYFAEEPKIFSIHGLKYGAIDFSISFAKNGTNTPEENEAIKPTVS